MSRAARRIALGLLIGSAAGVLLLHWVIGRRLAVEGALNVDRVVAALARAAADNAGSIAQWVKSQPAVEAYRVINIDDRTIEASSFADDMKDGTLPRRMVRDEKPLYDLAQELRTSVETNQQEGSARKEEISIQREGGRMLVAAPTGSGMVQIRVAPAAAVVRPQWSRAILFIFAPVVLFVAVAWPLAKLRVGPPTSAATRRESAAEVGGATLKAPALLVLACILLVVAIIAYQPRAISWPIIGGALALQLLIGLGAAEYAASTFVRNRQAYYYVAPAMFGMILLVFFPFLYGVTLSFTSQNVYTTNQPLTEIWNGLENYKEILGDFSVIKRTAKGLTFNYQNFYWTLGFTIAWTVVNVTIGVVVGLFLALILNTKSLALKSVYRVLLILPWAVPNYITALIWRGMFHQQFGVINQMIQIFGGSPISWFDKPHTSFAAVVATNGWLSFPFMMVVSLGALQSIPGDLYEAARVDGATRWQQFRSITLPSLKPALIPAIILSVVWTFNMFNIIYLVSAGEPAGSTEILITEAYKIAFEQYRYGYAAAYSTVIFAILLIYGVFQNRVTKATEAIA